ncbi:MAG: cell wall-binding repeat-containing protein [Actinobacteria bacterium]|nr:cell wall-binding repeat-containing protein [Actinomycetota bacterium]
MIRSPRRSRLSILATAFAVAATALIATPVHAVGPDATVVEAASSYLTAQLTDGDHLEGEFGPQYGPTADVAYALLAAGFEGATLTDVLAFLTSEESVDAYVHGQPFDQEDAAYVGATAKLGLLVTIAGMDPHDVGGTDLVETLQSLEAESGRYEDRSSFGNFANIFGQSFGLLFLAAEGTGASDAAIAALVSAQCADGGFPETWDSDPCESQVDATAVALQALIMTNQRDAAADAADYLVGTRDDEGAWGEPQNTNSTGYAGMALLTADEDVEVTQDFLVAIQNEDGGLPISPGEDSDPIATAQALPVLASESFETLITGPRIPTPDGIERLWGPGRIDTAIAISQRSFPRQAGTVVLARDDDFADALVGAPVATILDGPLLLNPTSALHDDVLAEIQRLLPEGSTVHLLGREEALSEDVANALKAAGYIVVRLGGAHRWETSVVVAEYLDDPQLLLLATGADFPDAMAAGAAAGANAGAVLLTAGSSPHPSVSAYLDEHPDAELVAVGGPAARAYPQAEDVFGEDRDATAVAVGERFFAGPAYVGVARRDLFADALAGSIQAALLGAPVLLTAVDEVPDATASYLCEIGGDVRGAAIWGGADAVSDAAAATVAERLAGTGC